MNIDPRCFVIMPMSDVAGIALKEHWDSVFEELFRPAIQAAGFQCLRSNATRGNFIKDIIQELWSADAVLADLTGQKANVSYELGVRHALQGRTILIAQRLEDIPSDFSGYARHIYDPRTKRGRAAFRRTISDLLKDIRQNPDRPDSPVDDFLHESMRVHGRLRLSRLTKPQRDASERQISACEQLMTDISRGHDVPIPNGSLYLPYFIELIDASPACERVRVFLSTTPSGRRLKYSETADKSIFDELARRVRLGRMKIEYTCLFRSKAHYDKASGRRILERHCPFAHVRRVFADEVNLSPNITDKTIVIMEQYQWAITHTWDGDGHVANAKLFVKRSDYNHLLQEYMCIRKNSRPFRCRRTARMLRSKRRFHPIAEKRGG